MRAKIYRIDKSLPLPKYETAGAAGFDFISRETVLVPANSLALIPGNVIIEIPDGYMLGVLPRSSTPKKKGLLVANSMGVIDNDYCGPEDEIKILVYNFTSKDVIVDRGERIAQGIFFKIGKLELDEIASAPRAASRNGFGSTG